MSKLHKEITREAHVFLQFANASSDLIKKNNSPSETEFFVGVKHVNFNEYDNISS